LTARPFDPNLSWCWKAVAGRWLLVTEGGGEQVILSPERHSHIQTRDVESGILRRLAPSDDVARIIAAAPDVRRHAQSLINGIDIGLVRIGTDLADAELDKVLAGLRGALVKSGAA
jgi:hypothetical protein